MRIYVTTLPPLLYRGIVLAAALLVTAPPARAQIRVPPITLPSAPAVTNLTRDVSNVAASAVGGALTEVRSVRIEELLNANRAVLDRDRGGNLIVRGEIIAFVPKERAQQLPRFSGVTIARHEPIAGLDLEVLVLSVPADQSIHRVLKELRKSDPTTVYDYNHIYLGVGDAAQPPPAPIPAEQQTTSRHADTRPSVGMIDSGVDTAHPSLARSVVVSWGCDSTTPAMHGTAVASLIAGDDTAFRGAVPQANLFAADVFCGRPTGGAVDAVARAFGWLLDRGVKVVNVSLVGPRNLALEAVVARVQAAGQVVVAAVGNDGPAAPPLYPAAYPGVVGVTGVDARRHVLLEANRGPQVRFAAPGADMLAAAVGAGYQPVRGTSFAAPIVAGVLAAQCAAHENACGARGVEELSKQAVRLGPQPVYGAGLVGESVRTPSQK